MKQYLVLSIPKNTKAMQGVQVEDFSDKQQALDRFQHLADNRDDTTTINFIDLITSALETAKPRVMEQTSKRRLTVGEFTAEMEISGLAQLQDTGDYKLDVSFKTLTRAFWEEYFAHGYDALISVPMLIESTGGMLMRGQSLLDSGGYIQLAKLCEKLQKLFPNESITLHVKWRDLDFEMQLEHSQLNPADLSETLLDGLMLKIKGTEEQDSTRVPMLIRLQKDDHAWMLKTSEIIEAGKRKLAPPPDQQTEAEAEAEAKTEAQA